MTNPFRIVSDGSPEGTKILCEGREVPGVIRIEWALDSRGSDIGHAKLTVAADLDVTSLATTIEQEELKEED
jgi:hypothetical protein